MFQRIRLGVSLLAFFTSTVSAHDASQISIQSQICETALKVAPGIWSGKIVILDTNVIFNDPQVVFKYPGAKIVIPGTVIEEVDGKKADAKLGRAARHFGRLLDGMMKSGGNLKSGVALENGSTLVVDAKDHTWILSDTTYDPLKHDNQILAAALYFTYDSAQDAEVYLISDDTNVRIKAASEGVLAAGHDYEIQAPSHPEDQKIPPYLQFKISHEELQKLNTFRTIAKPNELKMVPNQFVMLSSDRQEGSIETIARFYYDRETKTSGLRKLSDFSHLPIQPKNVEQAMLLDVLMDPTIHMVISESPAGTGKTFLSILAGMLQLADETNKYDKVMITRTLVQIGKETLGALPGDQNDKLQPWNENVSDALAALSKKPKVQQDNVEDTSDRSRLTRRERAERRRQREEEARAQKAQGPKISKSQIHLVAFPHLRGRSIADSFLILDEAQNASVHEMHTFTTRAGEGSKMVVLGDPTQIDSPFLSEGNNGLSVLSKLVNEDDSEKRSLVAYIRLTEGVRSELAEYMRLLFEKLRTSRN